MATAPVNGTVLHNVVVYEPGKKFVQKPKVIETLDFSKLKYVPAQAVETTKKSGGLLSKISNGLKSVGTKLKNLKGSKALLGLAIGGLLLGAAALIKKCSGNNDSNIKETEQPPTTATTPPPEATEPEKTPEDSEGSNVPPALPGEKQEGSWSSANGYEMICRDASGRTRDIKGKLTITSEFEKNPDEFTITDNSSGTDHVYKYQKIGVNDKGQPIYKCVSMNEAETTTENQYTLEWEDDKTPKLIQNKTQDNYGIGLKFGKATKKETAPSENKTDKPKEAEKENVEIWINRQPGPNQEPATLENLKEDVISACQNKRPLTNEEQEQLNKCQNPEQVKEYLKSIGIDLGIAY